MDVFEFAKKAGKIAVDVGKSMSDIAVEMSKKLEEEKKIMQKMS